VRLTRRDVRDHIKYSKTGCWCSYRFYRALQRLKSPKCIICEIFEAPRFFEFSTQSANSGPHPNSVGQGLALVQGKLGVIQLVLGSVTTAR